MVTTEPTSAIVIRVPVPRRLALLRSRWDPSAGAGVPAHVTVLFPFLPPDRLGTDVRQALALIAAAQAPFDVSFTRVGRFPNVVYLVPEPSAPISRLTESVAARYPDFKPYGGEFAEVIPHLTVTESDDAPLDAIATEAAATLPFGHRVSRLEIIVDDGAGRWHSRWRLTLGVRP
jgi:2'-5' RNA ligase